MAIYNIPRKPTGRVIRPGGLIVSSLRSLGGIVVPGGAGFWSIDARSGGQWLEHNIVAADTRNDVRGSWWGKNRVLVPDAETIVPDDTFSAFHFLARETGQDHGDTLALTAEPFGYDFLIISIGSGGVGSSTKATFNIATGAVVPGQTSIPATIEPDPSGGYRCVVGTTGATGLYICPAPNDTGNAFSGDNVSGAKVRRMQFYRSDFGGMIGAGSFNPDAPEYPAILDNLAQNPDGSNPVTAGGQPVGNFKPIAGNAVWTATGNDRPTLDINARLLDFSAGGKFMQTALTERTDQMWLAALVDETSAEFGLWSQLAGNSVYVGRCDASPASADAGAGSVQYYVNGNAVGGQRNQVRAAIRDQGLVWVEAFCDLADGAWSGGVDFGRLAAVSELSGTGLGAYAGRDPGAAMRSNIATYIQQQYPELPSWPTVLPA